MDVHPQVNEERRGQVCPCRFRVGRIAESDIIFSDFRAFPPDAVLRRDVKTLRHSFNGEDATHSGCDCVHVTSGT